MRIEYQDGGEPKLVPVVAGEAHWDEPSAHASTEQLTAGNYHTRKLLLPSSNGREASPILAEGVTPAHPGPVGPVSANRTPDDANAVCADVCAGELCGRSEVQGLLLRSLSSAATCAGA